MKTNLLVLAIAISGICVDSVTAQEKEENKTNLIVRGDDLGMTQGSIVAFEEAITKGILTCASIQVAAPWFEAAVELTKKHPDFCFGIHMTLIGEWRGYRWRPVLPYDKVSSIVDEDGYLHTSPEALFAGNPKPKEVEAEIRAQIDLALKKGIKICYLDQHYINFDLLPQGEMIKKRLSEVYNLPISGQVGEQRGVSIYSTPVEEKTAVAVKQLEELGSGLFLWVCHPGIDSPEQNALMHSYPEHVFKDQGVGKHRAAVLKALTSYDAKAAVIREGIILTDYKKITENLK